MRIIFAGTPDFAKIQLEALLSLKHHDVVAVYTQPDRPKGRGQNVHMSPVKALALSAGLKVKQPVNFKKPEDVAELNALGADIMIVAAYGLLLPKAVLDAPKLGCINVHASLLPRWRGAAPIQHAILANDQTTGITLMQMNEGLDTGDMLYKQAINIDANDNAQSLHDKLAQLGATCLIEHLDDIMSHPKPQAQDDSLATYAKKISKEDGKIQWDLSAKNLTNLLRAFSPWPGLFTFLGNTRIKVLQLHMTQITSTVKPGTITQANDNGINVATHDNDVCITQLQLPGKKAVMAKDMLHAHPSMFAVGQCFTTDTQA